MPTAIERIHAIATDLAAVGRKHLNQVRWQRAVRNGQATMNVRTAFGPMTIRIAAEDHIGYSLLSDGHFELDLIRRTMSFLRSIGRCPPAGQGTLLDIGANIGIISIEMLKLGEVARAVCVEPEPVNHSLLEENVRKSGLEARVFSQRVAVGDAAAKELVFEISKLNSGDHRVRVSTPTGKQDLYHESDRETITVAATTLDAFIPTLPPTFAEPWAVLWIDVQGYEGHVFRGARQLLSTGIPVVSELWPYGLARAGTDQATFCALAAELWSHYYVFRRDHYVEYAIDSLPGLFAELAGPSYDNVVFLKK